MDGILTQLALTTASVVGKAAFGAAASMASRRLSQLSMKSNEKEEEEQLLNPGKI